MARHLAWVAAAMLVTGAAGRAASRWARSHELMYEYACHEGNYGFVNMLTAARAEDGGK